MRQEPDAVAISASPMAHGQELWLREFCRVRAQPRAVKAFQKGVEARAMIGDDRLYARKKIEAVDFFSGKTEILNC